MNKFANEKGEEFFEIKDILECQNDFIRTFILNIQIVMKHHYRTF